MKQVTQILKTGSVDVNEVPVPALEDKFVLVRNSVSVISSGTEKSKIDMGKKNLFQKAKARPDLVKQVLDKLRNDGFKKTLRTIKTRLSSPSPLGYSCSGQVVAVGGNVTGILPGDRVACAGAGYANHSEYVAIPRNLVAKIPENISFDSAAFTTIGSIALQGVRLADPKIGETFLVLGLGLLGQIVVQILRANGCKVIGTDLDDELVRLSEKYGATSTSDQEKLDHICNEYTDGGVDGVIVCAGSSSNTIIETCGRVTREKGRVVVVGAIKMDIPREDYFKKEINVVISRSYGPGRYDPSYEERGQDYPIGYVRFTEQRNMSTFLDLLSEGKVILDDLISHRFPVEEASKAYELIQGEKKEPYLGILLEYSSDIDPENIERVIKNYSKSEPLDKINLSFFGAGNYATASLLPHLQSEKDISLAGLVTASGRTASSAAEQFGFSFCSNEYSDLLNKNTDAVLITTRHDSHAKAVSDALKAGKQVYVEKPLGLSINELGEIHSNYMEAKKSNLMIGFNRRFAPATLSVLDFFEGVKTPLIINIRVNAGEIAKDHWIQDPKIGGGRIIGECCHFIDLASHIGRSHIKSIYVSGIDSSDSSPLLNDNINISMKLKNGAVASILYSSNGSKGMPKELIEVIGGGLSAKIDDFKEVKFFDSNGAIKNSKTRVQDKGQKLMIKKFVESLKHGKACAPYDSLMNSSIASILAVESLMTGTPMPVNLEILEE